MTEKHWYTSRKLWISLVAAILVFGAAVGGPHLGLSSGAIDSLLLVVAGLTTALLGTHTYTDVMLSRARKSAEVAGRGTPELVSSIAEFLPQLLRQITPSDEPAEPPTTEPEEPAEPTV